MFVWMLRQVWETIPPRPKSANIGTATTVSHFVDKKKDVESFIMENLLTATKHFLL